MTLKNIPHKTALRGAQAVGLSDSLRCLIASYIFSKTNQAIGFFKSHG